MPDHEQEQVAVADDRVAVFTLVAGPFTRATHLRRFVQAIETLPGVREVSIVALQQGRLSLALQCAAATPLLERLQTLSEFPFQIEQIDQTSITIWLKEPTDSPTL